jgi:phosphate transport system permease protein
MADTDPTHPTIRRRKTTLRVKVSDKVARWVIAVGGIGTIAAVLTVGLYLVWVAAPLFFPSKVEPVETIGAVVQGDSGETYRLGVNDYETLAWVLLPDGRFNVIRLDTGESIETVDIDGDQTLTAFGYNAQHSQIAVGYDDGSIRLGTIDFEMGFVNLDDAPEQARSLEIGEIVVVGPLLYERVNDEQLRTQRFAVELNDPAPLSPGNAIRLIDIAVRPTGPIVAAVTADGSLHVKVTSVRRNMLSGKTTVSFSGGQAPIEGFETLGMPRALLLAGVADNAALVWADGRLDRYDTRDPSAPVVVETVDVVPDAGTELTALTMLLGKTSIAVGDSHGNVGVWFRIKPDEETTADGSTLVRAHFFEGLGSPVTALGESLRSRLLSAGYEDGTAALYQVTVGREVGRTPVGESVAAVRAIVVSPKEGSMYGLSDESLLRWNIDAEHPSVTVSALFGKVWYEGYENPAHVWQSSSGTDDFEAKFGLMPLIFGTVKATVYSLIFGAPLALLAAIYTSEFLHPRARMRIKPLIEMMASLPSVVLGFLAALIFAPFIENIVPQTLALFATLPLALLAAAHLVQLLPERAMLVAERYRLILMMACLPVGVGLAALLGPVFETIFFSGDIKSWLDGQVGNGAGGWLLLLIPISAVVVAFGSARFVRPVLRAKGGAWSRQKLAFASLAVFAGAVVATFGLAILVAEGLAVVDIDPRGSFVDTYVQRNALVVGFVMGFAIIPIIYTLAEDALSSVPEHLRSASLGAGATQWQTATRIVIPVAMSGLFSALMIGFGRAVGETMIVLMAAGNTPIMEWNIFNGFRTLSANIAVELPEAVRGSSHYRVLFLAALCLFVMTFLVNTVAEIVRQRFRKRAFQL